MWSGFGFGLAAAVLAAAIFFMWRARKDGARDTQAQHQQEVLDDVETAKKIRDRLDRDRAYAQRVRQTYTRS